MHDQFNPAVAVHGAFVALRRDDLAAAHGAFTLVAKSEPSHIAAWIGLRLVCERMGDRAGAIDALRAALDLQPNNIEWLLDIGRLLMQEHRPHEAEACFGRVFELEPSCPAAHVSLGRLAHVAGFPEEAENQFRLAIEADPRNAQAWDNLSGLCFELGRLAEAGEHAERLLSIDPGSANAKVVQGLIMEARGEYSGAANAYRDAVQYSPSHGAAHLNLGLMLLAQGRFEDAWPHFAWRTHVPANRQIAPTPKPAPSASADLIAPGEGRRITLQDEQSLGTTLFFLRFAPLLAGRGATVRLGCDPRLHGLLSRTPWFSELVSRKEAECAKAPPLLIGDLPRALGVSHCAAPLALHPLADRVARIGERMAALGPPPYIGITWRAGETSRVGARRLSKSIPPGVLGAALSQVAGTLVSVQREPGHDELKELAGASRREIHDFADVNNELEDALALMALLDDYVCVSNTNVYLRAGCGKGARVLVPHPPEWRWLAEGAASPWFPDFRLYRQTAARGWDNAMHKLSGDLATCRSASGAHPR
jgi:tetratricopeptide (TPR) repeat protein